MLAFGDADALSDEAGLAALRHAYPRGCIVGCSTAGEILDTAVCDDSLAVTAVHLSAGHCRLGRVSLAEFGSSRHAGMALAAQLPREGLVHVLLLSEGIHVNGSALAEGLDTALPSGVTVTGGLSADGDRFGRTVVCANGPARSGDVVAVGLYGTQLRVGHGSRGGWDAFGPERVITRAEGNVLYELDGRSALSLYRDYLGELARGLPAAGLRFPLMVRAPDDPAHGVVRTMLGIDEKADAITFAGEMPQGHQARLMKANVDRLIDGAHDAAQHAVQTLSAPTAQLVLLVSCVGRRLVLGQRTEEELESVREVVGDEAAITGFYSYGELCPPNVESGCALHNQTMTVTTLAEL